MGHIKSRSSSEGFSSPLRQFPWASWGSDTLFDNVTKVTFSDQRETKMVNCVAYGCPNTTQKKVNRKRFFSFPDPVRDKKRHNEWVSRIGRFGWTPSRHSKLCEDHFSRDAFIHPPHLFTAIHGTAGRLRLIDNAVPSLFKKTATRCL